MPYPDIPVPADAPVLPLGGGAGTFPMPADGSPLIVALDVPAWTRSLFNWYAPRRYIKVSTPFPSNTGVYGPNPTSISGMFGVVVGPGAGKFATDYNIARILDTGRHYVVVRAQAPAPGQTVTLAAK